MATKPYTPKDNGSMALRHEDVEALLPFAGRSLGELCQENKNLLAFPDSLGANGDEIDMAPLFWLGGDTLNIGNTVGFWGANGVHVHAHSRFDTADRQYFFHYMLQRVCGISVLNLQTLPNPEDNLWEFLMYLFPLALKRALSQGIFRAYRTFAHNDDHVRGPISVSAFLRRDMPFCGKIVYSTREHTANNHVMQLVRHTIEFIRRRQPRLLVLDREIRQAVDTIVQLTPDYADNRRDKVLSANLRPVRHPYYTEYTGLQNICLRILRHEKLSFGERDGQICGIVFDAAWLWEEYLASVFADRRETSSVVHPRNKLRQNPVYFYKVASSPHYPDFYDTVKRRVFDAKYKPFDRQGIPREDLFQLISYLHVMNYDRGVLLYPGDGSGYRPEGELNGLGGHIGRLPLAIAHTDACGEFKMFVEQMLISEEKFINELANLR